MSDILRKYEEYTRHLETRIKLLEAQNSELKAQKALPGMTPEHEEKAKIAGNMLKKVASDIQSGDAEERSKEEPQIAEGLHQTYGIYGLVGKSRNDKQGADLISEAVKCLSGKKPTGNGKISEDGTKVVGTGNFVHGAFPLKRTKK